MEWRIDRKVGEILGRGGEGAGIEREAAWILMRLPLHSRECYALMQTADRLSRERFANKGENHVHIGVNVEPCPFNCRFCSLTPAAGIFRKSVTFSETEIRTWARDAEEAGADALNIMTTGTFSFERLLEIGRMLAKEVSTPLVANTRDITHREGEKLLDAGFVGAYHAVRLGEGRDTPFRVMRRIHTIRVLRDVGLQWMNCVEPVGPEHGIDEVLDRMFLARDYGAVYSGIMRRINFPGSPMTRFGMISELEMARMVAVSRLVMGSAPRAHCTHEPHAASLVAGANLFFPEVGASPRDGEPDTAKGRGHDVHACRRLHLEMGWDPDRPSNCFDTAARSALPGMRAADGEA